MAKAGLRERKRQRTREAILQAARKLFVENGYHETSVAEIAERADIAISTLFGYFPAKADVFFADYDEMIADYVGCITSRDRGRESAIDATVRWHSTIRDEESLHGSEWADARRRLVDEDAALSALHRQRYEHAERVLAAEVAHDLGDDPDGLRPRLVAAIKVASYVTLNRYRAEGGGGVLQALDRYVNECLKAATDAIVAVPPPE